MKKSLLTWSCLACLALPALAQPAWQPSWGNDPENQRNQNIQQGRYQNNQGFNANFDSIDLNRDGRLDQNELARAGYTMTPQLQQLDRNQNGVIERSEWPSNNQGWNNNTNNPQQGNFDAVDSNRDGRLDQNELARAGYSQSPQLQQMDRNQNGVIERDEWNNYNNSNSGWNQQNSGWNNNSNASSDFNSIDVNRDGRLDQNELARAGYSQSPQLQQMDRNQNGVIELDEWNNYNNSNSGWNQQNSGWNNNGNAGDFNSFDRNRDGRLDRNELARAGYNQSQLQQMDRNQNGFIERNEWNNNNSAWNQQNSGRNNGRTSKFKDIDRNRDGRIDRNELTRAGYTLNNQMRSVDRNQDGFISRDEWKRANMGDTSR